MEMEITYNDYLNSSKNFMDSEMCPLAIAVKRALGRDDISVGTMIVWGAHIPTSGKIALPEAIYELTDRFGWDEYIDLVKNKTTFKTTLIEL
jgi:hypothetical protein